MKALIFTAFLSFICLSVWGQEESDKSYKSIGISYYGEFGLRPGLEIDYGIPLKLYGKPKEDKNRYVSHQFHLRPALAYYHYAHNSNNYSASANFIYQLRFAQQEKPRYFYLEPFVKVGYLRKSYSGIIYKSQESIVPGFKTNSFAGTNSILIGSGINLGGYISKRYDWLLGFDYFIEKTQDQLILHRFVAKLGIRIKLN